MILNFQSPTKLNTNKEISETHKEKWYHASFKDDEKGILELDEINYIITCSANNITEPISNWLVDEENHTMVSKNEKVEGQFSPLDYPFAVSMLGQLLPSHKLIEYLSELQTMFRVIPEESIDDEEKNNN